jgi:myosin protein heavy chain
MDDLNKSREKLSNLLATIDELQSSDSTSQLAAKRAERELREEKEKTLRLERELEGWKNLRVERRSALGVPASDAGGNADNRSRRGSSIGLLPEGFFVVDGVSEVKGSTRRSQDNNQMINGKLDPPSEDVEDLVSAVEFPSITSIQDSSSRGSHQRLQDIIEESESVQGDGGVKNKEEGVRHIEEVVYLDLDDGASTLVGHDNEVGEKEIEMEVDDDDFPPNSNSNSDEDGEGANGDAGGIKRKRTIRVIIRSRAFI